MFFFEGHRKFSSRWAGPLWGRVEMRMSVTEIYLEAFRLVPVRCWTSRDYREGPRERCGREPRRNPFAYKHDQVSPGDGRKAYFARTLSSRKGMDGGAHV